MGFIINQGKQNTSDDKDFAVIISEREVVKIEKVEEHKYFDNSINVALRIISDGPHKNRVVYGDATYDPNSEHSWKYRQLRKFAGVPYHENEDSSIDIEALLLNKIIAVELGVRKDKEGVDRQMVKYKQVTNADQARINNAPQAESFEDGRPVPTENDAPPVVDISEDDVPW